ncbi:MAG: FAD-dependent oxidoreductase, partial [Clostridium sp.]|nr:FAD-dependent oxidoreductase [Clostridium sp.]
MKVIIIGGGWAGTSAAISAKKAGAEVELYEKTDLLLGLGNVGGIMRNNGRYTATEELIALGVEDIFSIIDRCCIHKNIDFPGHKHAYLYNVTKIEGEIRDYLKSIGIKLFMEQRVVDVKLNRHRIEAIKLADGSIRQGDVFVEATGSTGPMGNCLRYGNGCSMCILRCPAFGPRISVSERCGVADMQG